MRWLPTLDRVERFSVRLSCDERRKVMKGRSLPIFSEVCEYFGHVFNCLEANLRVLIGFVLKNVIIKLLCDGTP